MQFYRRLSSFKAISFDLDDTLYHNFPVMMATDAKMIAYFRQVLPPLSHGDYDYHYWYTFRQAALKHTPELTHDVAKIRLQSYFLGIQALGFNAQVALEMANQALDYFVTQRSDFVVPENIHLLLAALKKHWPLIAISNGNVDTKAIGIAEYFSAIFHAGDGLLQKPEPDMFARACQQFELLPHQLLHVGDCGANDILGALRFGCQTAWVSSYDVGKPLRVLPHLALTDVTELHRLI